MDSMKFPKRWPLALGYDPQNPPEDWDQGESEEPEPKPTWRGDLDERDPRLHP